MTQSAELAARPTCGRCGVYRHLHPTKRCHKPRLSFWWDRHSLVRHYAGDLWLTLPERWRWAIVVWFYARRPHLCWCDLVDAAYLDIEKDDFRGGNGCGCDVPLPTDAREPRYGWCYCTPPEGYRIPPGQEAGQ